MKKGIPKEEVQGLIRATEENRVRLRETWQKIENLQAAVDASQDARSLRQDRQSVVESKSKEHK